MISVHLTTVFIGYVICFSALVLGFWLYPRLKRYGHSDEKVAQVFRCRKCGHVCFDVSANAAVCCAQCGHWNEIIS